MNNKKNNYQRPVMDVVKIQQVQMVCSTPPYDPQPGGGGLARSRGESSGDSKFDELW